MKNALLIPVALLVVGLVAGCGAVHGGKTIVKYDSQTSPIVTTVPSPGSYALFATTDYNPKVVENLSQNDQIGFRKTDTGQLVAVAGKREIPLEPDKNYYWKRQ